MGKRGVRNRGDNINYPTVQNMIESAIRGVDRLEQTVIDNTEAGGPGPDGGGPPVDNPNDGCVPLTNALVALSTIDTGLTNCYTTRALNEYVYVAGLDDGVDPTLQVYRFKSDSSLVFLSSLVLSQEIRRFVLHGPYIFGCNDGADGANLISVSVYDPWNPSELDQLDVGFAAYGLDAQGQYVYVVGGTASGEIAVVDVIDPTAMVEVT